MHCLMKEDRNSYVPMFSPFLMTQDSELIPCIYFLVADDTEIIPDIYLIMAEEFHIRLRTHFSIPTIVARISPWISARILHQIL